MNRPRRRPPTRSVLLVLLAAVLHGVLAFTASTKMSMTFDELAHLTAGSSYIATGDHRLQPENGWLPQTLIGLGLRAGGIDPPILGGPAWNGSDVWNLGRAWLTDQVPPGEIGRVTFWGRLPIAVVSALLVALIGGVAGGVFGRRAAVLAAGGAAVCPTFLAHGGLATSDTVAAFGFLLAVVTLWRCLHRFTLGTLTATAIAFALMALAKFSALLLLPVAVLMLAVRLAGGRVWRVRLPGVRRRLRDRRVQALVGAGLLVVLLVTTWAAVWLAFSGDRPSTTPDFQRFFFASDDLDDGEGFSIEVARLLRRHALLPEAYAYGLETTLAKSQRRSSFLKGAYNDRGFFWFFPYVIAVKSTLVMLAGLPLVPLAVGLSRRPRGRLYRLTPVLMLGVIYGAATMTTALNIGHRHLMPLYAVGFVLLGALACVPWVRGRVGLALTWAVVLGIAVESFLIRPDYLAYFNPLDGGPTQAYRQVVDSSLDWGQDLIRLEAWDAERRKAGGTEPLYVYYFGSAPLKAYGLDAARPLSESTPPWFRPLSPGWYAISVTKLQQVYEPFHDWEPRHETAYRELDALVIEAAAAADDDQAAEALIAKLGGAEAFTRTMKLYPRLRLARLTYFLRNREPDAKAGYSMHLYRIDGGLLREALFGPLPARVDDPLLPAQADG